MTERESTITYGKTCGQSNLENQTFSALRESRKRYVFSGENVIEGGLGGEISSVAANHSLTLPNRVKTSAVDCLRVIGSQQDHISGIDFAAVYRDRPLRPRPPNRPGFDLPPPKKLKDVALLVIPRGLTRLQAAEHVTRTCVYFLAGLVRVGWARRGGGPNERCGA